MTLLCIYINLTTKTSSFCHSGCSNQQVIITFWIMHQPPPEKNTVGTPTLIFSGVAYRDANNQSSFPSHPALRGLLYWYTGWQMWTMMLFAPKEHVFFLLLFVSFLQQRHLITVTNTPCCTQIHRVETELHASVLRSLRTWALCLGQQDLVGWSSF